MERAQPETQLLTSIQQRSALVQEMETHFVVPYLHNVRLYWGSGKPFVAHCLFESPWGLLFEGYVQNWEYVISRGWVREAGELQDETFARRLLETAGRDAL